MKPLIEKAMGVQTLREGRADETEFIRFPTGRASKRWRVSQVAIQRTFIAKDVGVRLPTRCAHQ
jgi:hypothetical protein